MFKILKTLCHLPRSRTVYHRLPYLPSHSEPDLTSGMHFYFRLTSNLIPALSINIARVAWPTAATLIVLPLGSSQALRSFPAVPRSERTSFAISGPFKHKETSPNRCLADDSRGQFCYRVGSRLRTTTPLSVALLSFAEAQVNIQFMLQQYLLPSNSSLCNDVSFFVRPQT